MQSQKKKYYHITHPDNLMSITFKGLEANEDGDIFLFNAWQIADIFGNSILVCDHIAVNQIFLEEFLILEINPKGFRGDLINDNVGESTAAFQWILKQPKISLSYIKVLGTRKPDRERLRLFLLPPT